MSSYTLIATAAFGLESVVARELKALGYDARIPQPGRIEFEGGADAIAQANLWLRSAERVLIRIATFEAKDFGQLFDGVKAANWRAWIPADGEFPVNGRSHKSQLSSVPACQKIVKKAVVEALREQHGIEELPETGATYPIEVALLNDMATITLDTTGVGLHKRGYRPQQGLAPLRETLAAAMVQLSFWRPGRPLLDPFCGAGTLPIEAAMIGRNIAPGLRRKFGCEQWPDFPQAAWQKAREQAEQRILPPLEERILATDADPRAVVAGRRNAEAAGVAEDIHFQEKAFSEVSSKRKYGCIIANPPYGERIGEADEVAELYESLPLVLRRFPTWSHYILTSWSDFEKIVGQPANRRRKLYNGRIACTYFQYHGPRPPKPGQASRTDEPATDTGESPAVDTLPPQTETALPETAISLTGEPASTDPAASDSNAPARLRREPPAPVFGGLRPEARRQAEEFASRLTKRARHLRKWPTKRGITCYRLYDRDIPEVPFAVDRYDQALHMAEYERPHDRTPAEHADWLDLMVQTAAKTLEISRDAVYLKRRARQKGDAQYQKFGNQQSTRIVEEAGLKFQVNLSDYLDTGLFLDHRQTRAMVRDAAEGKDMLNLFAYTGSFSVYAAAGGAASTTTVDLSANYLDWAAENFRLNDLPVDDSQLKHRFIQSDARDFLASLDQRQTFDLAVVDPPTFSNSKRTDDDWDVQQHTVEVLSQVAQHLTPGGLIFFSTNSRRFKLDETSLANLEIREISRQTVPEDFRNQRIHRCWRMVKSASDGAAASQ